MNAEELSKMTDEVLEAMNNSPNGNLHVEGEEELRDRIFTLGIQKLHRELVDVHPVHHFPLNMEIRGQVKEMVDDTIQYHLEDGDKLDFLYEHVHQEMKNASWINPDKDPLEHHVLERVLDYMYGKYEVPLRGVQGE